MFAWCNSSVLWPRTWRSSLLFQASALHGQGFLPGTPDLEEMTKSCIVNFFSSLERDIFASLIKHRVSEDKAFGSIPPPEKPTHLQESIFATFSLDPRKIGFHQPASGMGGFNAS